MRFMNTWDIDRAVQRYASHPIKSKAARIISDLRDLADSCSDGWCYWPKPARAARKLMELIEDTPDEEATEAKLKAALSPIKAFLTNNAASLKGRTIQFDLDDRGSHVRADGQSRLQLRGAADHRVPEGEEDRAEEADSRRPGDDARLMPADNRQVSALDAALRAPNGKNAVTLTLPSLEYIHLVTAVEAMARRPCRSSNCGTTCLCGSCAARRVLGPIKDARRTHGAR